MISFIQHCKQYHLMLKKAWWCLIKESTQVPSIIFIYFCLLVISFLSPLFVFFLSLLLSWICGSWTSLTTFVLPCPFLLFLLCLLSQGSSNPPAWHRAFAGGDGWEQAQAATFKPSVSACTLRSRACTGLAACPMCTAYGHGCSGRHLKEIASALCFSTPACLTLHPYTLLALSSVLNFRVSAVGLCVSSRRRCLAMELPCDIFLWESLWKRLLIYAMKKRMLKSSVALRDCTCSGHIFTLDHP